MFENENNMAMCQVAEVNRIRNYLNGSHDVLSRKDFEFNGETFRTAKVILQSIKQVIDFHSSYICGNPISITGDKDVTKLVQSVYRKGFMHKSDYDIAKALHTYGNAYEYLYREKNGKIKSKVIPNTDAYPCYENGEYTKFIERWCYNPTTDYLAEREYTETEVKEYVNGVLKATYNNPSGLPIHYNSGNFDRTNVFGVGVVSDLIKIMNEIEQLLSKMIDSITTLSMNPLGVVSGQRLDESVDSAIAGATINLDDGGTFNWESSYLDSNSIKLLLDNMINQYYTVAQVPSALYGQGNIANVSETSLELLFNNSDSLAKRVSFGLLDGFNTRLEYISKMLGIDVTNVDVQFNYNRPVDNKSMMESLKLQRDMGAISVETVIANSPYTANVEHEKELIENEININDMSVNKIE
jgi:SPP1 family phage portal protein